MRYANLCYVSGSKLDGEKCRINIGDYMQLIAIDNMYDKMGIPKSEIYYLTIEECKTYMGEYLILPINFMISDFMFCEQGKWIFSEKIIPVFLGICLYKNGFSFTEYNLEYLKRFSPIGCRDINTLNQLMNNGVDAYLSGCLSFTLPYREENQAEKIFFVDAPEFVRSIVPQQLLKDAEFIHHERELLRKDFYDREYAMNISKELLYEYRKNAKLIITSRLHCAAPCTAMGIPTIIVREYRGYMFDWIDQFMPIYLWKDREKINWNPTKPDIDGVKKTILDTAIQRLKTAWDKYSYLQVSDLYPKYSCRKNFSMLHCQNVQKEKIESKIRQRFNDNQGIKYALWGISDDAEIIWEFIRSSYPSAELVKVIDTYRDVDFHGITSDKPEILTQHNDFLTIVISINAVNAAKPFFKRIGKPKQEYLFIADAFMDEA